MAEVAGAFGASVVERWKEYGSTRPLAAAIMEIGMSGPLIARPLQTLGALVAGTLVLVALTFFTLREAARRKLGAAGVKVLPWRPHLILRVYRTSHRNLLESVRCAGPSFSRHAAEPASILSGNGAIP